MRRKVAPDPLNILNPGKIFSDNRWGLGYPAPSVVLS
jgi:hypothetical protein